MGCCWIKPKKYHDHKSAVETKSLSNAFPSPHGDPSAISEILDAPSASVGSRPCGDSTWAPSTSSLAPVPTGLQSPAHSITGTMELNSCPSPQRLSVVPAEITHCADSKDVPPTRPSSPVDEPSLDEEHFPEIQAASPHAPLCSESSPSPPVSTPSPNQNPSSCVPESTSAVPPVLESTMPSDISSVSPCLPDFSASADTKAVSGEKISKETNPERMHIAKETQINPEVKITASHPIPAKDSAVESRHSTVSMERVVAAPDSTGLKLTRRHLRTLLRSNKVQQDVKGSGGEGQYITKLLGLPNIGNTCFMNATLQCLFGLPVFCHDIIRQELLWPRSKDNQLLRQLAELHRARLGQDTSKSKSKLLRSVKRSLFIFQPDYGSYYQQDAHEFLTHILTKLQMEGEVMQASSASYRCPVDNFEFYLLCIRTCSSCGNQVYDQEQHLNLSLDLCSSVRHSLELYCKAIELECTCYICSGQKAAVTRRFLTFPRVLVLHLKRFYCKNEEIEKLANSINIQPSLSLSSVTLEEDDSSRKHELCNTPDSFETSSVGSRETPNSDRPLSPAEEQTVCPGDRDRDRPEQGASGTTVHQPNVYRLSGVISHLGESLNTGHYISDIAQPHSKGWLTMDDSEVSTTNKATVLKKRKDTAYILFYVLRQEEQHGFMAGLDAFSLPNL